MAKKKLHWDGGSDKKIKAHFSIEHVGSLSFEVESTLPGDGSRLTAEEKRALALRHAQLLVRGLAKELDRENL
jgi:hypothetical protein